MNQDLELKLQAWLDGELSESEGRHVEKALAADREAGSLVAELRAIKQALAGNELPLTVPETREFYFSKIQRQIERESNTPTPSPATRSWLHWLSPVVGLTGLACMLILAVKPSAQPGFDEISSTGEGMEAVTFHDQSAGMTVVWLADAEMPQPAESLDASKADKGDSAVDMD